MYVRIGFGPGERRDDRRTERRKRGNPMQVASGSLPTSRGVLVKTKASRWQFSEGRRVPYHANPTIVAMEQWLCLLLGFVCTVCGGWGVCIKYNLDLSFGYISWLRSGHRSTSRSTAVVCLVSGISNPLAWTDNAH
jgi:hypothetical protein